MTRYRYPAIPESEVTPPELFRQRRRLLKGGAALGAAAMLPGGLLLPRRTRAWMEQNPSEYGFLANVNPEVDHPRWSQARERLIGKRETLMFNGYSDEVAELFAGMDLQENF